MIVLLDTTVLIDVLRGRPDRLALLAGLVEGGHTLATAAINVGEVYSGMRPHEEAKTEAFLTSLDCYPMSAATARRAGLMKNAFAAKGQTLSLADMVVAATALEHGVDLMTDNRRNFPCAELRFYPTE